MRFKRTVRTDEAKPTTWFALGFVHALYCLLAGKPLTVTSMNDDGGHSIHVHREGSKHYTGDAFDARVSNITADQRKAIVSTARMWLAPLGYDVVSSETAGHGDHDHFEYDPKAGEVWIKMLG